MESNKEMSGNNIVTDSNGKSQAKQSGGSKNNNSGGNRTNGGGSNATGGKFSKSHAQGKSGKPCREIYRPPSLRTKTSRNQGANSSNNSNNEQQSSNSNNAKEDVNSSTHQSSTPQNGSGGGGGSVAAQAKPSSSSNSTQTIGNGGGNATNNNKPHQNGGGGGNSVPNSPLITRHVFNFNNQGNNNNRSLNANAKEFQFTQSQQQQIQTQQLANLLSQLDPSFYGEAAGALLASSGVYSLQQSKSLGNNVNLFLQHQQMQANSRQLGYALGAAMPFMNPFGFQNNPQQQQQQQQQQQSNFGVGRQGQGQQQIQQDSGPFNRLTQSKSSGSIPGNVAAGGSANLNNPGVSAGVGIKPRVRFDDEDSDEEIYRNTIKNAQSSFASMKINGEAFNKTAQQQQISPKSPIMTHKTLQKSRTGFYLNMYTPQSPSPPEQQMTSPAFPQQQQQQQQQASGILKQSPQQVKSQPQLAVKRSRSFGSSLQNSQPRPNTAPLFSPVHSVYSDFQISKWPRKVQETVTAAVTAVERVAARQQIEMVNLIFEAMLQSGSDYSNGTDGNGKSPESPGGPDEDNNWRSNDEIDEDPADLSIAAVHIFLYFIQREKDRTVMESLLNTCFATFQKLFGTSNGQQNNKDTNYNFASQCSLFLKFLSALYSQVKLLRRQNAQQKGPTMDEMSFTLLALLCDSCLATLRSRLSNDPFLMGCLFTVMTSQGRDMEGTFPLKMKQLLAAVRDALLGLGPYSKGPLSPLVQKTLMQLIELHAANWALPASAVRYYYSSTNNNSNSNKNSNSLSSTGFTQNTTTGNNSVVLGTSQNA